jgi:hypothetical protein
MWFGSYLSTVYASFSFVGIRVAVAFIDALSAY